MLLYTLHLIHWMAALVIVCEAVDKLHQCRLLRGGRSISNWGSAVMKITGWTFLAMAAAGALASPLFRSSELMSGIPAILISPQPSLGEVGVFAGFAVLIVRSWFADAARQRRAAMRRDAKKSQTTPSQQQKELRV